MSGGAVDRLDMDHNERFMPTLVAAVKQQCQCPGHQRQRASQPYQPRHAHDRAAGIRQEAFPSHCGFSATFNFRVPRVPAAPSRVLPTETAPPPGDPS